MNSRMGQAAAAYRQAAASVHPTVAVVKLYDATLLAISQAIRAREASQFEECFIKVMRAATILRGLDHALDFAKGGAVAERLHRVYKGYIIALHLSYGKPDVVRRYRKLHDSLVELRDAWAGIAGMAAFVRQDGADAPQPRSTIEPGPRLVPEDRLDPSMFIGLTGR
ncbi:flagellar export chaperone FliS [Pleomorphomonas sp. JP5]|uniref:flagellar export chaperone FliS n=1 Tax=Pleomorphomonas sp. JP5 TaxID=2942998 RepID=UPI0020432A0F|nr:flagellar export chaperone FliS [Pleomorphomonas sp. JP5]MCM5560197.1 flagellar protein FliS [Pleomorphomonas sp. JP5]